MKIAIVLLFLVCSCFNLLLAQVVQSDSSALKIKVAKADARHFRPNKQIRKAYRKKELSNTSDYFKPSNQTVSNSKLLNDSIYVKTYKTIAYKKTITQIRSIGTIIGFTIIIGIVVIVVDLVKLSNSVALGAATVVNGH